MAVNRLKSVNDFDSLLTYLRDELDWPVDDYGFDDLTFQYTATELGLDEQSAAKVTEIRRLRPLDDEQPWGIFFLELEPKRLPVVALRRLLSKMTLKKRTSSNRSDSPAWHADDILFISRMGESDERHLTFAHFAANPEKADLPVLKVLGWDASDTVLRVDHIAEVLKEKLIWPEDPSDSEQWRRQWRDAFTLKHREQITTAKEMASRLAELARGIRGAIQNVLAVESENGPMTQIMGDFKKSLVHDLDPEQFADTYAQTITYGLLSARITDPSKNTLDDLASHMQTNPFLKELMESFIHVGGRKKSEKGVGIDFDELGVSDVIDVLDTANMEAVVRDFGRNNQQEDPVIHFFEGFLQEYDKSIRKDRGVFYTPRAVVSFIVRSVDELLRTDFGLEDGLADISTWGDMVARIDDLEIPEGATPDQAFVQILDPATGTGTFLVEVIDLIYGTMTAKWQGDGLSKRMIEDCWNDYVPKHLLPRLHGYELMMAPYAIAHMKIGLKLYETGYRFDNDERARVYLTNALEPAQDFSGTLDFAIPALAHEAEAVNAIKRDQRFTVVIGNPPYSSISSNMSPWIRDEANTYISIEGERIQEKSKRNPLQNDYVKFMRLADLLCSQLPQSVFGLITSNSYLDGRTLRGLRWHLLQRYPIIKIFNLYGDSKKRDGGAEDENVFDITEGVSVCLAARHVGGSCGSISYTEIQGSRTKKYALLSQASPGMQSNKIDPASPYYLFKNVDQNRRDEFIGLGMALDELFRVSGAGLITNRDAFATDHDTGELLKRMRDFSNPEISDEAIRKKYGLKDNSVWKLPKARRDFRTRKIDASMVAPLAYRPFDTKFMYYDKAVVFNPRFATMNHMLGGDNLALVSTGQTESHGFTHVLVTKHPVEKKLTTHYGASIIFPLFLHADEADAALIAEEKAPSNLNLSGLIGAHADSLATPEMSPSHTVIYFAYAILYSGSYRSAYAEELRTDFPRIPNSCSLELYSELSNLGRHLVDLHLLSSTKVADQITEVTGSNVFQVEKVAYSDETVWIDKAKTRGFKGVREEVWNFHIGGYQVCEKWLKDRQAKGGKNPRPGRVLTDEDIEHYQKIVVALSETIRIMAEIDEVIEAHGGWPDAFQTVEAADKPARDVSYGKADEGDTQLDMVAEPKDG